MKRRKVWVGLGTAVLVTSQLAAHEEARPAPEAAVQGAPPLKVAQAHGQHGAVRMAAKAGEGGEGDEGGAAQKDYDAKLPPTLRFYRDIALIRGHLLVGDELVREGRWAEALPHFLHPSEEIYGKIRDDLKTYGVAPFAAALKSLAQTVKAKNEAAYRTAVAGLEERLAAADKGVRAKEQNWSAFSQWIPCLSCCAAPATSTRKRSRRAASRSPSNTKTRAGSSGKQKSCFPASPTTSRRRTPRPSKPCRTGSPS
jgi:hypothetical protein